QALCRCVGQNFEGGIERASGRGADRRGRISWHAAPTTCLDHVGCSETAVGGPPVPRRPLHPPAFHGVEILQWPRWFYRGRKGIRNLSGTGSANTASLGQHH